MLWEELAWPDIAAYLERDDRAIIPVGACEQHGPHLSFLTDAVVPLEIARRLSNQTGVPVAPSLQYGMSLHHMDFPGTISLSPTTFCAIVEDIVGSLYRHGFRRQLILNGHGGNVDALGVAAALLTDRFRDLRLKLGNWWQISELQHVTTEAWGVGQEDHAGVVETSLMLSLDPSHVWLRRAKIAPKIATTEYKGPQRWKLLFPDGAAGPDPTRARPEVGDRLIGVAVEHFVRELQEWN